jgi:hypothetical protein
VSSLRNRPDSSVVPSAIAARIKARFERLLLPGIASRASTACPSGRTRAAETSVKVDHGVSASSKFSSLIGRLHPVAAYYTPGPAPAPRGFSAVAAETVLGDAAYLVRWRHRGANDAAK